LRSSCSSTRDSLRRLRPWILVVLVQVT